VSGPPGAGGDDGEPPAIEGPLYYEVMGPAGAPPMLFIHPNPMDSACWIYQMAHFSTWYRCIAVDLPGYGRSPRARPGLTMTDLADACWDAITAVDPSGSHEAVLVGCSVGSYVAQHMYHRRPDNVAALVLCGAGWRPTKAFPARRIADYREHGIGFRHQYTLQDFSPAFRADPIAEWFATVTSERDDSADLESIITMFEALEVPDPDWLQHELRAPVLILTGSEDGTHPAAAGLRDRLPDVEMVTIEGAGHACHIEQPGRFDREMLSFLRRRT
jgi:pimeloyl-ACP methyl ester carboxylesterase